MDSLPQPPSITFPGQLVAALLTTSWLLVRRNKFWDNILIKSKPFRSSFLTFPCGSFSDTLSKRFLTILRMFLSCNHTIHTKMFV